MEFSNRTTNIIATSLLIIIFCLAFFSMQGISATMDELAHIPAGYSYLTHKDYRINPEHPPLAKDLSAIPLLFLHLNFPENHPSWTTGVNNQWWLGNQFLYHSGNNPDQIIFWARIPMILLLVFLGWFLFYWAKKEFGNKAALLTLTFFSFSPTFLAHGRLVTTDIAAALGVVIATCFWLKFLKQPTRKNIVFAGLIFGIAMLLKFSMALLIPFFAIITLAYAWFKTSSLKQILKYIGLALLVGTIGMVFIVWPIYQLHILNYPAAKQLSDTRYILQSSPLNSLKNLCIWMAGTPVLRPFAHFLLGLLMATQRTAFGNTVYFMGMVSASGWWYYFPIVYLLKVPLSFHILTLITILILLFIIKKPFWVKPRKRIRVWILNHFTEFSMLVFLGIYWSVSMSGNLNIGIRHILPTFPFMYMLVSAGIANWTERIDNLPKTKRIVNLLLPFLILWYIGSSLAGFPYYLSYFNELAGGPKNGYKYVVDSNYDWGQDLRRLANFVKDPPAKQKIKKIYVDYFGGGDPKYYLGEKYIPYNPVQTPERPKGWFAVSATLLEGGSGNAVPGFDQPTGYYKWLNQYHPVARAGNSIFIYYINQKK